ncbi:MAG: tetratricopeptide repeat protein [Bacteroidales bacterium]|nr:tetratricopeptide repeat protein [Bacteroidales bacterium]
MSRHKPHKKTTTPVKGQAEKKVGNTIIDINHKKNNYFAILAFCVFAFVLYGNTIGHDYALDDAIVITSNEFTQNGIKGIPDIFKYDTFTGFWLSSYPDRTASQIQEEKKLVAGGRYRPLSLVTFALEIELFGKKIKDANGQIIHKGNPSISHFINIILYFLTTCLLYIILLRLFPPKKDKKWYFSFAFITSILFLAHPIHTEAIANIKGRDEIMTLLGSLAAVWFTIKYLDTKKIHFAILSSVSLFLGLLSKENAITFLAIIPITIYYFTNHKLSSNLKASIPLLIAAGIFLLIRANVLGFGGGEKQISQEIMNNPFLGASFAEKMATIFFTLWMYIKLLIFPHPLTYDYYPYQIEIIGWDNPGAYLTLVLYLAIGIYAVYGMIKKKDMFSYGIWFYLLPLSVVSNIFFPVGTFMNERFVFISSIGFCLILAWLIYKYIPKIIKDKSSASYFTSFIMIIVLGLYSVKTISRNKAWENDLTLFTTDVQTSSNSAKSNCSAGGKLIEEAQKPDNKNNKVLHDQMCKQAIGYLEHAIEIYPNYVDALNLLGNAHYEHNFAVAKSLHYYAKVLKIRPFHNIAYNNSRIVMQNAISLLTNNYSSSTPEDILKSCDEIIKAKPEFGEAYHLKGTLYGKHFNIIDSAFIYLQKAEKINFEKNAAFYKDLGVAYGMKGYYNESLEYFHKAIELDPNDAQSYFNLGVTYQQLGDVQNANLYLQKSEELKQKQAAK